MVRLGVIGVGRIGGEVAYLAASLGIADDFILYDNAAPLLHAQMLDLQHTGLPIRISTDINDFHSSDICVFAAGTPRNPEVKARSDLLNRNLPVAQECAELLKHFSGILITVTNPVDINNYYISKMAGIPREHCIGFGGQLDSARFALALRKRSITGFPFVLGEHGEHQVPLFSMLSQDVPYPVRDEILAELRGASMEVIRGKGGTVFGPALHIIHLIRAVTDNKKELMACSCILEGEYGVSGCSLGAPARIGRNGIDWIEDWTLDRWEQQNMDGAARFLCELTRRVVT